MTAKTSFSESEWQDLLQCFLTDSIDHLEGIEARLLQLESAADDAREELTNHVFRAAHSIKGSSGMFGFTNINKLSHKIEWQLENLRSGKLSPSPELIDILLNAFDSLRHLVENSNESNEIDVSQILKQLEQLTGSDNISENASLKISASRANIKAEVDPEKLQQARSLGLNILAGRIDLIAEFDQKDKPLTDFLKLLHGLGTPVLIEIDTDAFAATIDQQPPQLPMDIVYTTEIGIEDIDSFLEVTQGTF
ncbi:MAG: Hpt domain-containing protein, partial [Candidatus Riflebacteria bacterium]